MGLQQQQAGQLYSCVVPGEAEAKNNADGGRMAWLAQQRSLCRMWSGTPSRTAMTAAAGEVTYWGWTEQSMEKRLAVAVPCAAVVAVLVTEKGP